MIARIVEYSVRNRNIVLLGVLGISLWGVYALFRTPVDAIPDLSENQVIVWADWPGRSPQEVEDQITYPLSVNLQGLAGVKAVRSTSEFGYSMINVIFDDSIEFYFARQRIMERLSTAAMFLPMGVVPYLAPDATALGQIFWYTVEGEGKSLEQLRTLQDWYIRYQLNSVSGVAQVASAGGFVREYQVDVDPEKLRAYEVSLGQVFSAVSAANSAVGGKLIHKGGSEYLVRGSGYINSTKDIEDVVVAERRGVPIRILQLATVQIGPAFRRSMLEKGGGEAVGGVVMMRYGENPLDVTERIKRKIQELQAGLPPGVRIVPFYDRTPLINDAIHTLTGTLIEEIVIATLVVMLVLVHVRSAIVICITLPLAVLISFIFMHYLKIPSNIMSLSGIAISIGVLIDAGIVMTENAYHRLHDHFPDGRVRGDTRELVIEACKVVGGPLFFSILIMLISFAPVFALGGLEGKMFHPLAFTKSFALVGVAVLAITLVPALIPWFVRGRLRGQEDVWIVRSFVNIYKPMLEYFLKHPDVIVVITGVFLVGGLHFFPEKRPWSMFVIIVPFLAALSTLLVAKRPFACLAILLAVGAAGWAAFKPLGEEFMPPLDEGSIMDMPVTRPNANITQVADDIKARDTVLRGFPEVSQVVGKVGRAATETDPAPVDMVETIVTMRPKEWWPKRKINFDDALAEARRTFAELEKMGILSRSDGTEDLLNNATMEAVTAHDRAMRDLAKRRMTEFVPEMGRKLIRTLRSRVMAFLAGKGVPEPPDGALEKVEQALAASYAARFDEVLLLEDVTRATDALVDAAVPGRTPTLLAESETAWSRLIDPLRAITGREKSTLYERMLEVLEARRDSLMRDRVKRLNWEIADRTPGALLDALVKEILARSREQGPLVREPSLDELAQYRDGRAPGFGKWLFLWPKLKSDIVQEMDSDLRVPGWSNIWTQPIINRVDMLATGVTTMVGVRVYGEKTERIQDLCNEIAAILKTVPGAVDVSADPIIGEYYLEIAIDRERAARYGVSVRDVQDTIEVALGGKDITMTVEGSARFPVRVRYPRDWREDEDRVKRVLVTASAGMEETGMDGGDAMAAPRPSRIKQVPLSMVADIRIRPGPSMIKTENGQKRLFVRLNVRDRDVVGFVEEAQRAVAGKVKFPTGYRIEWTGQFEHQVRAQRTLMIVVPLVMLIIFVILYMTYRDLADTVFMFLSVPGAIAGGALFQALWGHNFSVAVMVGYIACMGLATETGIVMMVYLREAIDRRGGLAKIRSEAEIRDAVIDGAVHRLRPKLLTEGTTVLALIPMLWATGAGAEFMRPMAAPILGGVLLADEVIDIFIPVLFYWSRCRRWRKLHAEDQPPVSGQAIPIPPGALEGGKS